MSGDLKRKRDEEEDAPNKRRKLEDGVEPAEISVPTTDEISIPTITQEESLDSGTLDNLDINLDIDVNLSIQTLPENIPHQEEDVSVLVRRKIKMSTLVKSPTEIIDDVVKIEDDLEFLVESEPIVYKNHSNDSEFKHLHWSEVWNMWVGVCENDGDYDFVFDTDQLACAEKLNWICQEKNLRLLNAVSVRDSTPNGEWQTTEFKEVFLHATSGFYCALFESCQASSNQSAEHVASRLNARCLQKNIPSPNPNVEPEFTKTDFADVYYVKQTDGQQVWMGQCTDGQGNTKRDEQGNSIACVSNTSAEDCAVQLNQLCASRGFPMPNPLGQSPVNIDEKDNKITQAAAASTSSSAPSPLPTPGGSNTKVVVSSRRAAMLKMLGKSHNNNPENPQIESSRKETHVKKSPSPPPYNSPAFYDAPSSFQDNIQSFNPMQEYNQYGYGSYYNAGYFQPVQQRTSRIMDQFPLGGSQWGNFAIPEKRQRRKKQRRSSSRLVDPSMPRKKSKFKGVYWETRDQKWRARIYFEGRRLSGGSYVNEREAALAVNRLCQQLGMEVKNPELDSIRLADEDPYVASRRGGHGRPHVKSEYGTPRDVLAEPSSRIRSSGPTMGDNYYGNIQVKQEPRYGGYADSLAGGWS